MSIVGKIFKSAVKVGKKAPKAAKKIKSVSSIKAERIKEAKALKRNKLLKQAAGIAGGAGVLLMETPKKTENSTKKVKKEPVAKQVINRAKAAAKKKILVAKNK